MRGMYSLAGAIAAAVVCAPVLAQSYNPIAFGPLSDPGSGFYYTSINDISRDGLAYLGTLNNSTQRFFSNGTTYTLSGTGTAISLSANGQVLSGGSSLGTNPQRWNLASAVGTNIASQNITWPGGPIAYGAAYGVNANATVFNVIQPSVAVITAAGYQSVQPTFLAVGGSAGAYRGMAADAPIVAVLGSTPASTTNAYRWNYSANTLSALTMPAGASSVEVGSTGNAISADGTIMGGSAVINAQSLAPQPVWWDAAGSPHMIAPVAGRFLGAMNAVNPTGVLGGGGLSGIGLPTHAFLHDFSSNTTWDLNTVYAGILPAGWTLTFTQHVNDDASRIFCLATDPTGAAHAVMLTGTYAAPTPSGAVVLGAGLVLAGRRRR